MQWIIDLVFPPRDDERIVRGTDASDFTGLLSPALAPVTDPATTFLLPFRDERVRAAIHETKYHASSEARALLAEVLTQYLMETEAIGQPIIIPIPMSAARTQKRGENHVEHIVEKALRSFGSDLPYLLRPELLIRTHERPAQVTLSRVERLVNMHDAFTASTSLDPTRTYIVIDDVITTGATLAAAVTALRSAGAIDICLIALAH